MSDRSKALLREALTLPPDERADVAAEFLASLDDGTVEDPAAVQDAWAKEIERRSGRVLAGESAGEPWEDVRDRIARRLTER
jgi:putative addiction module component (TIGR02574 family)